MDVPVLEVSSSHHDPRPIGATVAGRYQLRRILGRGGAAVVFAADHVIVHRPVALKLPLRNPDVRELLDARLRRETKALAHVRHPAIVDIIDAGEDDGMPYLAMELLEGRTLSGLLSARGRLDPEEVIKLGAALAEGLATAHSAGVIHRDVKPANVLITREARNQIHLCDFGIARLIGPEVRQDRALTQLGAIIGTPEYMPLEAFLNGPEVDHRADVFSLGMMLYECLTGALPVEGAIGAILRQRTTAAVPQLHELRPDVPRQLSQVIARCLAQEPEGRFSQMTELASALRACTKTQVDDIDLLRSAAANPAARVASQKPEGFAARRAYARAPYVTLASLQRGANAAQDARIEDLSEGGALLVTRDAYKANELVKLRFGMPISGRVYALNATVRWSRAGRGSPATGIEFNNLPDAAREEIRKYVALMSNARTGAQKA
jgi:tRNA A-37 threonylcarbamoyl transferase component Bud32